MPKLLSALLLAIATSAALAADMPPPLEVTDIPSPAAPGSRCAVLARGVDGAVWMAWLEPATKTPGLALRCAMFGAAAGRWGEPHTVAEGHDLRADGDDLPAFTVGEDGRLAAVWPLAGAGRGEIVSLSENGGLTWSAPSPLSRESRDTGCASLTTLADGRVLAAWLDRRGKESGNDARLYLRFITGPLMAAPDWLLDGHVSECCQPDMAPLLDGGAMIAYRGRVGGKIRDIRVARLHGRRWENRHVINPDNWTVEDCPGDGPAIAADGGRVVAAWFTGADSDPRVLVSTSPDAGARFLMTLRADAGRSPGHPAAAILHDGAVLVTWTEAAAGGGSNTVWTRRAAPEFNLDPPKALGPAAPAAANGPPRIALARDYGNDNIVAQAIVAFTAPGTPSAVRTVMVTVPEAALLAATNESCHCAPTPAELTGYPLRGTVVAMSAEYGTVVMDIDAAPGVMDAGRHAFFATRELLGSLAVGRQCLARVRRDGGTWWLFDARLLEEPR